MTTGLPTRRTDRVRTPNPTIEISQHGKRLVYKLLEITGETAVVQGALLDPEHPLVLHVARAGRPARDVVASVSRQVPILGRALIELALMSQGE